eukprot:Gregarina_sp_Poly_1__2693@NODE_173_length_12050_cov_429_537511_g154_i0_p9_GENE_NODE_173_length_12050_cov_429_537511_g154_i0NODE_173_length_12050_cov_429_537511_g154_i0_p9_ORF_typecomplete_len197_score25_50Ldh_1_C/PF02866_18/3_4e44_NODE_173_length_12050_cov_429_537511_g154_i061591
MAGILDSSRFRYFLSEELGISPRDIQTMVLGGHGDTMVPLKNYTSIGGVPIQTFIAMKKITPERLDEIVHRTRKGGEEIVNLLKVGSAFVAPACSAIAMVESYLKDEKRMLPCCAQMNGEYGLNGVYGGVPVVIGSQGVEQIVELPLDEEEKSAFDKSMASVAGVCELCRSLGFDC